MFSECTWVGMSVGGCGGSYAVEWEGRNLKVCGR